MHWNVFYFRAKTILSSSPYVAPRQKEMKEAEEGCNQSRLVYRWGLPIPVIKSSRDPKPHALTTNEWQQKYLTTNIYFSNCKLTCYQYPNTVCCHFILCILYDCLFIVLSQSTLGNSNVVLRCYINKNDLVNPMKTSRSTQSRNIKGN